MLSSAIIAVVFRFLVDFQLLVNVMSGDSNILKKVLKRLREALSLEKLLMKTSWFIIPSIYILFISIGIFILVGAMELYNICQNIYNHFTSNEVMDIGLMVAHFIELVDMYILGFLFYILAVGAYELFIGEIPSNGLVRIKTVGELKSHIAKMGVLFLATLQIKKIAEMNGSLDTLLYSGSTALICLVLIFYFRSLDDEDKTST